MNSAIEYCLGLALSKFPGIKIIGYTFMFNHYHIVLFDRDGDSSKFIMEFNRTLAKVVNVHLGRTENVFSNDQFNRVLLADMDAVIRKIDYMRLNPVKAGLVKTPGAWPGVMHMPNLKNNYISVKRPKKYFKSNGNTPKKVQFKLFIPDFYGEGLEGQKKFIEKCNEESDAEYKKFMEGKESWKFSNRKKLMNVSPFDYPNTDALYTKNKRTPRFATQNALTMERIQREHTVFQAAYRLAMTDWKNGNHDVVFPPGTYKMVILHNVSVGIEAIERLAMET